MVEVGDRDLLAVVHAGEDGVCQVDAHVDVAGGVRSALILGGGGGCHGSCEKSVSCTGIRSVFCGRKEPG